VTSFVFWRSQTFFVCVFWNVGVSKKDRTLDLTWHQFDILNFQHVFLSFLGKSFEIKDLDLFGLMHCFNKKSEKIYILSIPIIFYRLNKWHEKISEKKYFNFEIHLKFQFQRVVIELVNVSCEHCWLRLKLLINIRNRFTTAAKFEEKRKGKRNTRFRSFQDKNTKKFDVGIFQTPKSIIIQHVWKNFCWKM